MLYIGKFSLLMLWRLSCKTSECRSQRPFSCNAFHRHASAHEINVGQLWK